MIPGWEKGMATHSSILAWRIPWTEEPGGLQTEGGHENECYGFHLYHSIKLLEAKLKHQLSYKWKPKSIIQKVDFALD